MQPASRRLTYVYITIEFSNLTLADCVGKPQEGYPEQDRRQFSSFHREALREEGYLDQTPVQRPSGGETVR